MVLGRMERRDRRPSRQAVPVSSPAVAYFKSFADGTDARSKHLKDLTDMEKAIADGTLPPVVFYKPIGALNEHPGYADVTDGDEHVDQLLSKIEASPIWKDAVVIVTSDENGGFWD